MAGGAPEHVELAMPIFDALRPEGPREEGFAHAGPVGAGHFSKMVHNGIEYGLMQAYAEGFELMSADRADHRRAGGAAGLVARHRGPLLAAGPAGDRAQGRPRRWPRSTTTSTTPARVAGPSRRRSTHAVPLPVISAALFARFASRQESSPAMRAVAALRQQFGGHAVKSAAGPSGTPGEHAGPSSGTGSTQD